MQNNAEVGKIIEVVEHVVNTNTERWRVVDVSKNIPIYKDKTGENEAYFAELSIEFELTNLMSLFLEPYNEMHWNPLLRSIRIKDMEKGVTKYEEILRIDNVNHIRKSLLFIADIFGELYIIKRQKVNTPDSEIIQAYRFTRNTNIYSADKTLLTVYFITLDSSRIDISNEVKTIVSSLETLSMQAQVLDHLILVNLL